VKLHEALTLTYAAVGQEMSDAAVALVARDLADYPLEGVFAALGRCRKELRRIVLADILERIPGGHPGPEEAWGMVAHGLNDERVTMVWTDEIREAFFGAFNLQDDPVAARMAFKEIYARKVNEARSARKLIVWTASLGQDAHARDAALLEAAEKGRLRVDYVRGLLSHRDAEPTARLQAILDKSLKKLGVPVE